MKTIDVGDDDSKCHCNGDGKRRDSGKVHAGDYNDDDDDDKIEISMSTMMVGMIMSSWSR